MTLEQRQNIRNPLAHWPKPLAVVLSGGGAYGAVQVGMLQALEEAGIVPDMVVGTSVGALNGALLAADRDTAVERLTGVWNKMDRGVFGGRNRFSLTLSALRNGLRSNNQALSSPHALRSLIDKHLPVELIEDLAIPTAVVVTDALVGVPKILTQGAIGPALQASAAIPGVFPPVKIEACLYVDGGVTANVPVRQAIAFGARSLIVCNANPSSMPGTLPDSVIGAFVHASQIMLRNQRADATEDLVGRYPILNLPQATPASQSSFDFANSAQLMEIGYDTSRDFLSRLPELTDASPPPTDAEEPVESPPPPAPRPAVDDAPPSRIAG